MRNEPCLIWMHVRGDEAAAAECSRMPTVKLGIILPHELFSKLFHFSKGELFFGLCSGTPADACFKSFYNLLLRIWQLTGITIWISQSRSGRVASLGRPSCHSICVLRHQTCRNACLSVCMAMAQKSLDAWLFDGYSYNLQLGANNMELFSMITVCSRRKSSLDTRLLPLACSQDSNHPCSKG